MDWCNYYLEAWSHSIAHYFGLRMMVASASLVSKGWLDAWRFLISDHGQHARHQGYLPTNISFRHPPHWVRRIWIGCWWMQSFHLKRFKMDAQRISIMVQMIFDLTDDEKYLPTARNWLHMPYEKTAARVLRSTVAAESLYVHSLAI